MSGKAELRDQIACATDLQSVVRTMKALAASSIAQYERSVQALAVYDRNVEIGLGACLREIEPGPPQRAIAGGACDAVIFGSDQGLVGRFNEAVADHAIKALGQPAGRLRVWAVGEKVQVLLTDAGLPMAGLYPVPGSIHGIAPLVGRILVDTQRSRKGSANAVLRLFHHRPQAGATSTSMDQQLLPLDQGWRHARAALPWPVKGLPEGIEPAFRALPALVGEYLFVSLYRACAESLASENASRLAAMQRADQNISDLLEGLAARFNRERQSGIDEELFDVIAGVEALMHDGSGRHVR